MLWFHPLALIHFAYLGLRDSPLIGYLLHRVKHENVSPSVAGAGLEPAASGLVMVGRLELPFPAMGPPL